MCRKEYISYKVDNEEPDCGRCDFQCENCWTDSKGKIHDNCVERCGANHGWNMYQRNEYEEVED